MAVNSRHGEYVVMVKRILGLDLGPNSIGWAVIEEGGEAQSSRLIDMGVRVFTEGLEAYDSAKERSRNEERRVARGMRRQTARRRRRRNVLIQALIEAGLWPSQPDVQAELLKLNPYELRAAAADPTQNVSLHELGRVFLSLSRRRGFLSNKKADAVAKETEGLLHEIQENEAKRLASGQPTVGAWLAKKLRDQKHTQRSDDDIVRGRHLSRKQYQHEFDLIWQVQSAKHPEIFTESLRYGSSGKQQYPCKPTPRRNDASPLRQFGIEGLVLFQRKMYWSTGVIGKCELEPKKRRCPLADRRYQRFRIRQELNNLRYVDPDSNQDVTLTLEQRNLLFDKLWTKEKLSFGEVRKALGFLESVRFNLERGERSYIKGNSTDHLIASSKHFGKEWHTLSEEDRTAIVEWMCDPNLDEREFADLASSRMSLSEQQIERLLGVNLPTGYGSLSIKAINRLLPHLEKGLTYSLKDEENSALHAAGYLRRDQLKRRIFDYLPSPQVVRNTPIGNIPNPVVKRTLTEVRKLVNAVIREYGKPDAIHVEMARDLKMGSKKRKEITSENAKRAKEREAISVILREHGERPTRDNILRYQLWKQQKHECIYTGRPISLQQLWGDGGGVEIDHILPRSRTLDESQSNKVLCFRTANSEKGNRTPYEWLHASNPARYEEILTRANHLLRDGMIPYSKFRKLTQKEVDTDDFVNRQLVDTAYITKVTSEYLRCLFDGDHHVLGLKGALTAELRWQWGLETILEDLVDSPAWQSKDQSRPGEKNRSDHRHHAIDAVVIALTNRSRLHGLAKSMGRVLSDSPGELLEQPWPSFRQTILDRVSNVYVSHRVERKIRGALHEATHYGTTGVPTKWVIRKPIESLSANEFESIRDAAIRELVISRLRNAGIEFGRGKTIDPKKLKEALTNLTMPSGVPIRKVRIIKPEQTIRPIREGKSKTFVKPGSTHHLCIYEWKENGKTKRDADFITMLEAAERAKLGKPIIDRSPPKDHDSIPETATFVMSLSTREMVLLQQESGTRLVVYRTAASTERQIRFCEHTDARKSSDYQRIVCRAKSMKGRKVTVDLLGRLRFASD